MEHSDPSGPSSTAQQSIYRIGHTHNWAFPECRQKDTMVYAKTYMQRSMVIAFENRQIMKPPISRKRMDMQICQYKIMC